MECPKYIRDALRKRADFAERVFELDCMIADWLDKNGVDVDFEDVRGGCEIYVNPHESSNRVLQAIEEKENIK